MTPEAHRAMDTPLADGLLLTDLHQLATLSAYAAKDMAEIAVFELFVRRLPETRGFLMAAGLESLVGFLERMRVTEDELGWLRGFGNFAPSFLDQLAEMRCTGDLDAMPEGTVFFPDEPILRVTAPLPQAQLIETRLINLVHFQTVIASKAARMVLAAPGPQLVDFGLRRAHGAEAGGWLRAPAILRDSMVAPPYWRTVRSACRYSVPWRTPSCRRSKANCAYKLQEYAGRARRKRSEGKTTWPGRKQVWRRYLSVGRIAGDTVALLGEAAAGEPLLRPACEPGRRVSDFPTLGEARAHAAQTLTRLPEPLRHLEAGAVSVVISRGIRDLADALDRTAQSADSG